MKILVTGSKGQVGSALLGVLGPLGAVVASSRADLDLTDAGRIRDRVRQERPDVIVNCAAYNKVDQANDEPAVAQAVNAAAPGILAEEAHRVGAVLIHYSTDYVFDGVTGRPYREADAPNPLSLYGRSKLEGEARVRAAGGRHVILRTSWVYAENSKNFLLNILKRAAQGERLRVVSDQTSVPTWALDLARLTKALLESPEVPLGTWHAASAGATTRYAYVVELLRLAGVHAHVEPALSREFAGAVRPAYSVLDSRALAHASGIPPIGPWNERLSAFLASIGRLQVSA